MSHNPTNNTAWNAHVMRAKRGNFTPLTEGQFNRLKEKILMGIINETQAIVERHLDFDFTEVK